MKVMNYTSIEQSKKLVEYGLDRDTADLVYQFNFLTNTNDEQPNLVYGTLHDTSLSNIPCWSVGALMKAMCRVKCYYPHLCRHADTGKFICCCSKYDTPEYDAPIDACFDMMCWLFEERWMHYAETLKRCAEEYESQQE